MVVLGLVVVVGASGGGCLGCGGGEGGVGGGGGGWVVFCIVISSSLVFYILSNIFLISLSGEPPLFPTIILFLTVSLITASLLLVTGVLPLLKVFFHNSAALGWCIISPLDGVTVSAIMTGILLSSPVLTTAAISGDDGGDITPVKEESPSSIPRPRAI